MASVYQTRRSDGKTYEEIIASLNAAGVKTTHINKGKEADFEDYGNALSTEVKNLIMNSFDNERDYEMQKKIAGFFTSTNNLQHKDFKAACKQLGYTVEVSNIKTQYISDYKGGNFSNSISTAHLTMFTISDGMGGEIVIIDDNGNGAIESEELFMNQILGDINLELGQVGAAVVNGSHGGSGSGNIVGGVEKEDAVSQEDFNNKVEEYLNSSNNITVREAERKAKISLKDNSLSYTGSMEDKTPENEISQEEYNKKVDEFLYGKTDLLSAEKMADLYLDVNNFTYSGTHNKKNISQEEYNKKVENNFKKTKSINDATSAADKSLNIFNMTYTGSIEKVKKELEEKELANV